MRTSLIVLSLSFVAGLACAPGALAQQQRPPAQPQRAAPPAAAQAAPQAQPQTGSSTRTEILTFDSWTTTCRDGKEPADKRVCSAELQIVQTNNNANTVVFSWLLGLNNTGAPVSVMRFPSGVLIAPGVELKLAAKDPRKIPFTVCEPNRCDAAIVMDDAFIRDAVATQTAEATIYASDGRGVKFTINMKGFQQALAIVRK